MTKLDGLSKLGMCLMSFWASVLALVVVDLVLGTHYQFLWVTVPAWAVSGWYSYMVWRERKIQECVNDLKPESKVLKGFVIREMGMRRVVNTKGLKKLDINA